LYGRLDGYAHVYGELVDCAGVRAFQVLEGGTRTVADQLPLDRELRGCIEIESISEALTDARLRVV